MTYKMMERYNDINVVKMKQKNDSYNILIIFATT